ncbi:MAG: chromosomal replication initiator protein DnaA [Alphaproteobacteria bacterium]|nr:chromosomal replication initiator protein DnaA [Alphaproteobacteria bacterium]
MGTDRDPSVEGQWARVRAKLRKELGDTAYRSWIRPLTLLGVENGEARLGATTRFVRDWVRSHHADLIRTIWASENREIAAVDIAVQAATTVARSEDLARAEPPRPAMQLLRTVEPAAAHAPDAPEEFGAALDARFTFDTWVVGKSNEFATAAARRVAEDTKASINPLFLYGGVGLGKTHLMTAIAWHIRRRHAQRRVMYLSAEKFMFQFIRAMRSKDTMSFKEQFRSVDVLMIDDVQFIAGKDATQEEFFHTFNALVDQNKQIVLSADKSPSDLEGVEERVKSRLGWGLVADIHPTTYELRLGILQAKAERAGVAVPLKVLEFLAHKITQNIRELEGALNRITAHATLIGRPITIDSSQEVLHDLIRANDRRVTIEEIQKRVAEHFAIRLADMHSPRRARAVARPRQVAMYLSKQLTSRSLPEIGRKFGGRDHTTVMHAVRKIEELRASDHGFAEDIDLLRRMLES